MESTRPGRPRSAVSRNAILEAAFSILSERGYAGMALEAVAAVAGAGKTTIYRWWPGRADLAVDAFFHVTRDALRFPDTGSIRDDFRQQIAELAKLLRGDRGRVLAAMLGAALTDPALATALGSRWLQPRQRWGMERMNAAAAAGLLRPGVQPQAALAILYGPLYTPLLFGGSVPSAEAVEALWVIADEGIFQGVTERL